MPIPLKSNVQWQELIQVFDQGVPRTQSLNQNPGGLKRLVSVLFAAQKAINVDFKWDKREFGDLGPQVFCVDSLLRFFLGFWTCGKTLLSLNSLRLFWISVTNFSIFPTSPYFGAWLLVQIFMRFANYKELRKNQNLRVSAIGVPPLCVFLRFVSNWPTFWEMFRATSRE